MNRTYPLQLSWPEHLCDESPFPDSETPVRLVSLLEREEGRGRELTYRS